MKNSNPWVTTEQAITRSREIVRYPHSKGLQRDPSSPTSPKKSTWSQYPDSVIQQHLVTRFSAPLLNLNPTGDNALPKNNQRPRFGETTGRPLLSNLTKKKSLNPSYRQYNSANNCFQRRYSWPSSQLIITSQIYRQKNTKSKVNPQKSLISHQAYTDSIPVTRPVPNATDNLSMQWLLYELRMYQIPDATLARSR